MANTHASILAAARRIAGGRGPDPSVGAVARLAGVSRITVYNHFGSREGLYAALRQELGPMPAETDADRDQEPVSRLARRIAAATSGWAADPALHRRLQSNSSAPPESGDDRALAHRLAASDLLRPGCSIKEAEDVIGLLTSFAAFDRLHAGGRRSAAAVAEILMRLAREILAPS